MRYRWDGFLGQSTDVMMALEAPLPEAPSGAFADGFTMPAIPMVFTNAAPAADQGLPITIPAGSLVDPFRATGPTWPIIPEAPNPNIAEVGRVMLPGPSPSPTGPNNAGIFADISAGLERILTPIVRTGLPLLERYGVVRPVRGPSRLPLPGEPRAAYALSVYGPGAVMPSLAGALPWLALGGLGLLLLRGRRGR